MLHLQRTRHVTTIPIPSTPRILRLSVIPRRLLTMAPTVGRSSSQAKISNSFRSSTKATKPLKQNTSAVKPATEPVSPPRSEEKNTQRLAPNDPKLVSAARAIEEHRRSPFGIIMGNSS